jgi:hypothetical protein
VRFWVEAVSSPDGIRTIVLANGTTRSSARGAVAVDVEEDRPAAAFDVEVDGERVRQRSVADGDAVPDGGDADEQAIGTGHTRTGRSAARASRARQSPPTRRSRRRPTTSQGHQAPNRCRPGRGTGTRGRRWREDAAGQLDRVVARGGTGSSTAVYQKTICTAIGMLRSSSM